MPNVLINTSPIQYLYQTNTLNLLFNLYGEIILPQSVVNELTDGIYLGVVLPNLNSLPWINIKKAQSRNILPLVTDLGAGEREALALAIEINDSLLVLDDNLARRYASLLGLSFTGTLGVLLKAKQEGFLLEIKPILDQLDSLNFRLSKSTRNSVLKIAKELF